MHLAIHRLWPEALEKIFVAIGRVKATHTHVAASQITVTKQLCLLLWCELFKSGIEVSAGSQLVRRLLCPVGFSRPRRTIEDDLSLAL